MTFSFSFSGWGETESTWYVGHSWPIVPAPDDRWWLWSSWWNENWQVKPKYTEKTCPSATLSTTSPTWPDLGSNPGRRGGNPATNRLSYGTAQGWPYLNLCQIRRRNSAVGIATGYRPDGRGVGVRVPVRVRFFSSPRHPDRFWGPPSILSNGYRGLLLRG
jgi:hypothetical protein